MLEGCGNNSGGGGLKEKTYTSVSGDLLAVLACSFLACHDKI